MSKTEGTGQYNTQLWDLDWSYTIHLESGSAVFSLNRVLPEDDNPHVEFLIPYLNWTGKIPDERAEWPATTLPLIGGFESISSGVSATTRIYRLTRPLIKYREQIPLRKVHNVLMDAFDYSQW